MQLIFIPGLLCTSAVYGELEARLPYACTHLALPEKDRFSDIVEVLADNINQFADPVCLCGISFGSYLAMKLAHRIPEKIGALILISATALADTEPARTGRKKVVSWARKNGINALSKAQAKSLLAPQNIENAAITNLLESMANEIGLDVFEKHQEALCQRSDQSQNLSDIAMPTLVMTGKYDVLNPPERGMQIASNVRDGSYREIPGAGHLPVIENPDDTAAQVKAFLASLPGEGMTQ